MIGLLLSAGADVTMRDNRENTALHHAAMRGVMQVIKALVDAGSEIDAQNKQGWTPLMNACYWCQPDAVAVFIELGELLLKSSSKLQHRINNLVGVCFKG